MATPGIPDDWVTILEVSAYLAPGVHVSVSVLLATMSRLVCRCGGCLISQIGAFSLRSWALPPNRSPVVLSVSASK